MRNLILSFFLLGSCYLARGQDCQCTREPTRQVSGITLRVEAIVGSDLILSTDRPLLPGTLISTGSAYYIVYQGLDRRRCRAKFYRSLNVPPAPPVQVGQQLTYNGLPAYEGETDPCYWIWLRNIYLRTQKQDDGLWLYLENGSAITNGKFPKSEPFMLSVRTPPIEGYFCLLEIRRNTNEVIVYFPNDRPGTDAARQIIFKGVINLTYRRREGEVPPFANLYLKPGDSCHTIFVGLISKVPRPLSDFLPEGHRGVYKAWNGTILQPWQIGPGFYQSGALPGRSGGIVRLPGDSWAAANLQIDIE